MKTGDEREARGFAAICERQILAELDAKLAGRSSTSDMSHFEAIAKLTRERGFSYKTAKELAEGDLDEILDRVKSLQSVGDAPGSPTSKALLGAIDVPSLTLKQLATNMENLNKFEIDNKNQQQLKDWKQKWIRVSNRLVTVMGIDPVVDKITRNDIIKLRNDLQQKVNNGLLDIGSANKDLQYLGRMIRDHYSSLDRKDFTLPTEGIRCKAVIRRKKSRKPPIPLSYLNKWIDMSNWNGVNDQLRDILLICLETGCRESEIYNLPPSSIVIQHEIPHIVIQEEEGEGARQIKTTSSERRVPLVGVALEAARRNPEGFPRYRGNRNFSNTATKALRSRHLIPTTPASEKRMPNGKSKPVYVTAGGVRHSFEDRLGAVGVEMDTRGELLGHDVGRIRRRQHYGDKDLVERLELHSRIMLGSVPIALPAQGQDNTPTQ